LKGGLDDQRANRAKVGSRGFLQGLRLRLFQDPQEISALLRRSKLGDALNGLDSPSVRMKVALMPTKTIAYLRVSTEKQARSTALSAPGGSCIK
jgi:hypothetical protein